MRRSSAETSSAFGTTHASAGSGNRLLSLVMQNLRETLPPDSPKDAGFFTVPIFFGDEPCDMPLAYFITRGCTFARAGACTMCNFGQGSAVGEEDIIGQVAQLVESLRGARHVLLTPIGSMFDDSEVPPNARKRIFAMVRDAGFRSVATDSRAEYLRPERLAEARAILGDQVELEIGIGLESANDWVRSCCINKMLSKRAYVQAIAACHRFGFSTYTHVLLKPPFLSEGEAIDDALRSVHWALEQGSDRVGLALMSLKEATLTTWLSQRGLYSPPWYWSVIEVLRQIPEDALSRVGLFGFDSRLPVLGRASNCPSCSSVVEELLRNYCYARRKSAVEELVSTDCACREEWEKSLRPPAVPLVQRVLSSCEVVTTQLLKDDWSQHRYDRLEVELNAMA